jgi:single-stranded-DNA-specific exonuclease
MYMTRRGTWTKVEWFLIKVEKSMAPRRTIWELREGDSAAEKRLAATCGISPVLARVLANRGIVDEKSVGAFLMPDPSDMHDPFAMPDMEQSAARLWAAVENGEGIRVYGDYDVDGITSVALLVSVLRSLGANVDYHIPNRLVEGYGLNREAIEQAAGDGVSLLVTVDCGVSAIEEVDYASELGIDVIITDHHEAGSILPSCVGVVDPKRHDSRYPFKELAGVGVAFKLAQAVWTLAGRPPCAADPHKYLDIVALGTIADVVPLQGENRIIAKAGLELIGRSSNHGINALLDVSDLSGREIRAGHVSFTVGPRVNAAGRLGDPSLGARLLLTDSAQEAAELAAMLDEENRKRQEIELSILREAWVPVSKMNTQTTRAIVLGSDRWHSGVIGIVASRIAELTYRPTVLISFEGDVGRGSARSIPAFNLYSALTECSDLLLKYGGHSQAAGLSIKAEDLDLFRERLNEIGHEWLTEEDLVPRVLVDAELGEDEICIELAMELERLEPFGYGNPTPLFVTRNMHVLERRNVGPDGKHLKLKLGRGGRVIDAIGFRMAGSHVDVSQGFSEVDVLYSLEVNEWNGRREPQLIVKDLRKSQDA